MAVAGMWHTACIAHSVHKHLLLLARGILWPALHTSCIDIAGTDVGSDARRAHGASPSIRLADPACRACLHPHSTLTRRGHCSKACCAPQAELDAELAELRASEQSKDVKLRVADIRQELSHYRTGSKGWFGLW